MLSVFKLPKNERVVLNLCEIVYIMYKMLLQFYLPVTDDRSFYPHFPEMLLKWWKMLGVPRSRVTIAVHL